MIEFRGVSRANMYKLTRTLHHTTSRFQDILLAETAGYGKALFLDNIPQSSELDEFIYHETLIHPALVACPRPERVFIAGGGEGAVLREILKHNTVKEVVMVDIDDVLISLVKEHLPEWHQGAFDSPKVQVLHEDARAYLQQTTDTFDCIFGDLPDPLEDGPAALLFTQEFFSLVKSRLNPGGTFALQAENTEPGWCKAFVAIINNLKQAFPQVVPYQTFMPFYGLSWGFAVAGEPTIAERLTDTTVEQVLHERGCTSNRHYDAETHRHMFSLPRYLRDMLNDPKAAASLQNALPLAL